MGLMMPAAAIDAPPVAESTTIHVLPIFEVPVQQTSGKALAYDEVLADTIVLIQEPYEVLL